MTPKSTNTDSFTTCGCRDPRPPTSSGQPVLMEEATQTIGSS